MAATLHPSPADLHNLAPGDICARQINRWLVGGGYDAVSWVFACALLVAAALKALALYSNPGSPSGWSAAVRILEAAVEWTLAIWILSGYAKAWARRAVLTSLAVFALVAGFRWFNGHEDCGCFGKLTVHPRWTFGFDALALILLLTLGKLRAAGSGTSHTISRTALGIAIAIVVPALTILLTGPWANGASDSMPVVVLEPLKWRGQVFPLLNSLQSPAPDLASGRWTVVLVDQNCHRCRDYVAATDFGSIAEAGRNVVLIDLATEVSSERILFRVSIPVIRMKPKAAYVFDGPFLVSTSNGIVESVVKPPVTTGSL